MHDVLTRLTASAPWGPLTAVKLDDGETWTLGDSGHTLPGGYRVLTSFNLVRFAPAWGLKGAPRHFETLVTNRAMDYAEGVETYATEAEAIDGHAVVCARIRAQAEANRAS